MKLLHTSICYYWSVKLDFIIFIFTDKVTGCLKNLTLAIFLCHTTCLTGLLLNIKIGTDKNLSPQTGLGQLSRVAV